MSVVRKSQPVSTVRLVPPNPYGYIFLLAETDPASVATDVDRVEFVPVAPEHESLSRRRAVLHRTAKPLGSALSALAEVRSVSVFEAILFGPGSLDKYERRGGGGRRARYDTLILIETTSPATAQALLAGPDLDALMILAKADRAVLKAFPVRNAKKIADVDRTTGGVFLFNFFFADDTEALLNIWDRTAQWWFAEGGMHNSELMLPLQAQDTEYALINNARWDDATAAANAFRNPDYWDFVLANIEANQATAMPSLYRLVG